MARLIARGYRNLIVIDQHRANPAISQQVQPDMTTELADLSQPGDWMRHFEGASAVVMLQAQIDGIDYQEFMRNNLDSTRLILEQIRACQTPRLVHVSSSVIESVADDFYTRTKTLQEQMVLESGIACPILRPTLMFGGFDRKHPGWLSRFMFPIR